MTAPAKKKAHIISSFEDAGTGESFTVDDTPMIEAGAFTNYEAAGLVRAAPTQRKAAATSKGKAPTRRRSASPRSSSASAPVDAAADKPAVGEPAAGEETAPSK